MVTLLLTQVTGWEHSLEDGVSCHSIEKHDNERWKYLTWPCHQAHHNVKQQCKRQSFFFSKAMDAVKIMILKGMLACEG